MQDKHNLRADLFPTPPTSDNSSARPSPNSLIDDFIDFGPDDEESGERKANPSAVVPASAADQDHLNTHPFPSPPLSPPRESQSSLPQSAVMATPSGSPEGKHAASQQYQQGTPYQLGMAQAGPSSQPYLHSNAQGASQSFAGPYAGLMRGGSSNGHGSVSYDAHSHNPMYLPHQQQHQQISHQGWSTPIASGHPSPAVPGPSSYFTQPLADPSSVPHSPIPSSTVTTPGHASSNSALSHSFQMANARQRQTQQSLSQQGQGQEWAAQRPNSINRSGSGMEAGTIASGLQPQAQQLFGSAFANPYQGFQTGNAWPSAPPQQRYQLPSGSGPTTPVSALSRGHSRATSVVPNLNGAASPAQHTPMEGNLHISLDQARRQQGFWPYQSQHTTPMAQQVSQATEAVSRMGDAFQYRQPPDVLFSPEVRTPDDVPNFLEAASANDAGPFTFGSDVGPSTLPRGASVLPDVSASSAQPHSSVGLQPPINVSELEQETAAANGADVSGGDLLAASASGGGRVRRGSTGIGEAGEDVEDDLDPEAMAKKDPLATQVWRMYAKQKSQLSNGARMENITWRMMALTLRKKKEQERAQAAAEAEVLSRQTAASGVGGSFPISGNIQGGAVTSTSTSPDLTHSAASHPSSRRSSGSQGEPAGGHPPLSAMKGSTALYGMTALDEGPSGSGRAKGRARFAEVFHEEEERGRRGRNSKTPDSGHG